MPYTCVHCKVTSNYIVVLNYRMSGFKNKYAPRKTACGQIVPFAIYDRVQAKLNLLTFVISAPHARMV